MKRRSIWILGVATAAIFGFVAGAILLFGPARDRGSAERYAYGSRAHNGELPTLWQAPAFSLADQSGKVRTEADLHGHVWIADFFYSTCTSACPLLTAKLVALQRQMLAPDLRFVSFSVDPAHDTQAMLAAYAATWRPTETRWLLLSTTPDALARVTHQMRVDVEPTADARNPILHTSLFFLVDAQGGVRGVYDSSDDQALARLRQDAAGLLGASADAKPPPLPKDGAQLFTKLNCAACHANPQIAPPLTGIAGTEVTLTSGARVTVDETYLRDSILSPGRQQVAGFANLMPSYRDELSDPQVDVLVRYLMTPSGTASAPNDQPVTVAKDPVCGMSVRVTDKTERTEVDGHTYYFCSPVCREKFSQHPNDFLAESDAKK